MNTHICAINFFQISLKVFLQPQEGFPDGLNQYVDLLPPFDSFSFFCSQSLGTQKVNVSRIGNSTALGVKKRLYFHLFPKAN